MLFRTLFTAAAVATLASSALARPEYNQLTPGHVAIPSKDGGLFGMGTRAADDFFLTGFTSSDHFVTSIQVVMIGDATPVPSKLGVTIRENSTLSGIQAPGAAVRTLIGARSVAFAGSTGVVGRNKYLVTFVPTGADTIILRNSTRYWIAPFARADQSGSWGFARRFGAVLNQPARRQINLFQSWLPFIPSTDCAFRIVTIQ